MRYIDKHQCTFLISDFDHFYNLIRSQKKDYIETGAAAKKFLTTNIKEKFSVFQKYIAAADDAKVMLSERTQDPDWFEGELKLLSILYRKCIPKSVQYNPEMDVIHIANRPNKIPKRLPHSVWWSIHCGDRFLSGHRMVYLCHQNVAG